MESLDTLLDGSDVGFNTSELLIRFCINIIAIFLLVRVIYYPRHKNKDFLFTFFLFNCLNFLICFLLSATKIKVGFAFGLFAIFSIMRYRTVMVPVKEMGYFFVCVAIGIINALATVDDHFMVLLGCNAFILGLTLVLDRNVNLTHENVKEIKYERIDLIHPSKRKEMIEDLIARTGMPFHRVDVVTIDFLRDVAVIHAYYFAKENETKMAGVIDDE
ncbi:MAG: DUF4956 domain-containing protein [Sphingobacteriales bacterium]|nr:MAG: DUF4956 domain-containing protein [Sphingobacteriales bacterium]